MTQREFFTAITEVEALPQELKDYATEKIIQLDNRNSTRSSKPTKKQLENEPIKQQILEYLATVEKATGCEIAEAIGANKSKICSLCVQLTKAQKISREEVKISKVGTRIAYSLVAKEET